MGGGRFRLVGQIKLCLRPAGEWSKDLGLDLVGGESAGTLGGVLESRHLGLHVVEVLDDPLREHDSDAGKVHDRRESEIGDGWLIAAEEGGVLEPVVDVLVVDEVEKLGGGGLLGSRDVVLERFGRGDVAGVEREADSWVGRLGEVVVQGDARVLCDHINFRLGLGVAGVELAGLVGERAAEVSRDGVGLAHASPIVLDRGSEVRRELGEVLRSARLTVGVHLLEVDAGALEDTARAGGVG